jgi:hypothetical protein
MKRSERKITDRIKDEKLNQIEICVCALESELWIGSDEWVIRWINSVVLSVLMTC